MRIELLHLESCPGSAEAISVLQEALAEKGICAEVETVQIDPDDWLGSPGSPTILFDGEDLFPIEEHPATRAVNCRIYATPEGSKNHPTAAMVREALARRFSEEQPADPRPTAACDVEVNETTI